METTLSTPFAVTTSLSTKRVWTGRVISGFAIAFLIFDTVLKLLRLGPAVEGTTQLGYPASAVMVIGIIEAVCLAAYAFPRTAVLGAVLLTGYLGGAVASNLRIGAPLPSHTLFPLYIAALIWGGLYLRDTRLGALLLRR
jgi:hypothetical protein